MWASTIGIGPETTRETHISLRILVTTMRGSSTDLPKTVDVEEITIRETDWGDMHVNITTCHKTLDIAPLLKGLPNDMCQCPHWGMILKGRKQVKYADHAEVLNAGDAYYMAPGHSTVTDAGTEWLEISPINELKKTNEAVQRNLAVLSQKE
jgi:hypothetical protein